MEYYKSTIRRVQAPFSQKRVNSLKLTPVQYIEWNTPTIAALKPSSVKLPQSLPDSETIGLIKIGDTTPELRELLDSIHRQHRKTFSSDLTGGYNGYYGTHKCHLNWASDQRPEAKKIPIANWEIFDDGKPVSEVASPPEYEASIPDPGQPSGQDDTTDPTNWEIFDDDKLGKNKPLG